MRCTVRDLARMKRRGEKIAMITAYDSSFARLVDDAGIPLILVGDSLGNTMLGHRSTVPVTLDDMVHHTAAVVRATSRALVVADLPFFSYATVERAVAAAQRLLQHGGAQAVKLEGGAEQAATVACLVRNGAAVMGHLGYTPQSEHAVGRARVQGRGLAAARRMLADARALEEAGAFALVLELVPEELAGAIAARARIPVIGIGAGARCDGQVQVLHDVLGLDRAFQPRHARRYAELGQLAFAALTAYAAEVQQGAFPAAEHGSTMDAAVLADALAHAARHEDPADAAD
jgi:3-methyl-2-oxobutanoate hydroxymethyltransferase